MTSPQPTPNSSARKTIDDRSLSWLLLFGALITHYLFTATLSSEIALDLDTLNLMFGMERFDLKQHSPHPPGYLLYIGVLRVIYGVVGGDPLQVVQLTSRLFSLGAIALTYVAVKQLRPHAPIIAGYAAVIAALNPFLIYYAVDGQTHTSEAFAAALLILSLLHYQRASSASRAALMGVVLAIGSALRPSFVVAGVLPVVWVIAREKRWGHLFVAGGVSVAGALVWISLTFHFSGGYDAWKLANDALVKQIFFNAYSIFAEKSGESLSFSNLKRVSVWSALVLLPVLALLPLKARWQAHPLFKKTATLTLLATIPTLIFYVAMFCSEPGYFEVLVPFVIVLGVMFISDDAKPLQRRAILTISLVIELTILMLPGAGVMFSKLPSIPEIITRDVIGQAFIEQATEGIPDDAHILVICDPAGLPISRQLPLLRPNADYLSIYASTLKLFEQTTLALATKDQWIPVPGPVLMHHGPPTIVPIDAVYDYIVISTESSPRSRQQVQQQTPCPVSAQRGFVRLPAKKCFPNGKLVFDGQGITFRVR